jgi:hypothetical protein
VLWLNLSTSEGQLERGGRNVKAISIIKLLYMFKASCGIVVDKHIILFQEEFEDTKSKDNGQWLALECIIDHAKAI